jgi:hypothetical protein
MDNLLIFNIDCCVRVSELCNEMFKVVDNRVHILVWIFFETKALRYRKYNTALQNKVEWGIHNIELS